MSRGNNSLRLDRAFWLELIRFLLVGVYGTLIDYVVEVWATSIFASWIGATENYIAAFFIQFLGYMVCLKWSGWGINILDIDFSTLFGEDIKVFASYTVVFVLKTAFTTVFNYVTRKFILYRKAN